MNNLHNRNKMVLPLVDMVALVKQALTDGRLKICPDGALNVDGIQIPPAPPAGVGPVATNPESENKFRFDGETWTLQFDGKVVFEPDWLGLHYIEQLIQRPCKDIHSSGLVTGAYGESEEIMEAKYLFESGVAITEADENEIADGVKLQVVTTEFRDEILPDEDRTIVLGLLEKSKVELAILKTKGSVSSIPDKEWEIEEIEKYLAKTRFGRKNACFDSRAEKDRKSVAKAIKEAIQKIAKSHPSLAEHLRKSIKTGVYCSYQPETEIHWEVAEKWRPVASCK